MMVTWLSRRDWAFIGVWALALVFYVAYLHHIVTGPPNPRAAENPWYFAGVVLIVAYSVSRPLKNLVVEDRASTVLVKAGVLAFLSSLTVAATIPVLLLGWWSAERRLGLDEFLLDKEEALFPCTATVLVMGLLAVLLLTASGFRQRALFVSSKNP